MVSSITITGGATGTGNGTVTYSVAANPTTTPRTGTVAAAGQTFTLNQAGACSFNISPTSASWPASPSTGSVAVTTTAGCAWTATSPVTWITVTGGASGTGNGTVNYSVAANTGTASRNATLSIAGRAFTVTQAGVVCTPSLSATGVTVGAGGGPGTVGVTAAAGCTWTASSGASWLTVTGGSPGNGNGTVSYNVAPNGTASSRTGTLTIAGQTYTVTQEGVTCSFSLSPTSSSVPAASSTGSVSVTAPGGCTWNAVSGAAWITVTSGGSGSGNGTVGYSVAANTTREPAQRIDHDRRPDIHDQPGGRALHLLDLSDERVRSVGCLEQHHHRDGGDRVLVDGGEQRSVDHGHGEAASGNGNGTVSYSVAANPNTTGRSGTITVAGQTFTVNQAGVPCAFSIAPTGSSVAAAATSGTVGVTAQTGCAWTAVSNATWITVTAGAQRERERKRQLQRRGEYEHDGPYRNDHDCRADLYGDPGGRAVQLYALADDGHAFRDGRQPDRSA